MTTTLIERTRRFGRADASGSPNGASPAALARPRKPRTPSDEPNAAAIARLIVLDHLREMPFRTTRDGLPRRIENALVAAVARELRRRYGGNEIVNRLEAEALVHTVLNT